MTETMSPDAVHAPLGAYCHTALVPAGAEWLAIAGQVGKNREGRLAEGVRAQTEQAFRNILTCLEAHGMGPGHIVKQVVYLTDPRGIEDYRAARREVLGDAILPPSTLVIIDGLAAPEMLVEIEAWAAKA